jgi:hypothetical protein
VETRIQEDFVTKFYLRMVEKQLRTSQLPESAPIVTAD